MSPPSSDRPDEPARFPPRRPFSIGDACDDVLLGRAGPPSAAGTDGETLPEPVPRPGEEDPTA